MYILVSNDDGVDSLGLQALAQSLSTIPRSKVVIVAPDREQSGASHSLTLHRPLRLTKRGKNTYCVDGTPSDAVMLGVYQVLKRRPDLVVSGINRGANLGEDVHYSGTVAAAMEGALMGIPSLAISVVGKDPFQFDAAAKFARQLSIKVLQEGLPKGVVLNVNVPNLPSSKIKGHVFVRQGAHHYENMMVEKIDPRGRPYFWIGADPRSLAKIPGTDCQAIQHNKITIVPIKADLTDDVFLNQINTWKI